MTVKHSLFHFFAAASTKNFFWIIWMLKNARMSFVLVIVIESRVTESAISHIKRAEVPFWSSSLFLARVFL